MKAQFTRYRINGFSTIELLIALALMTTIMVAAVEAVSSAQYWLITATTASEALVKGGVLGDTLTRLGEKNFQMVSSTRPLISNNSGDPADASCLAGGLCYETETIVTEVSSCAKNVIVNVSFKISPRYATSTITRLLFLENNSEISAVYGDCPVLEAQGNWAAGTLVQGSSFGQSPLGTTGIDVVGTYLYTTSVLSPYLRIFQINQNPNIAPVLIASSTGADVRLNDIDVMRDLRTGRLYAYVTQHSTSSQLAVYDVTVATSLALLLQLPLFGVASNGSFPQGWRVMAYGGELYVVSRETTGPELHIFSLLNPRVPIEKTSTVINLNRTVNDMVVRDEIIGTVTKRFLYLAASADLKEVGVYDVTGSVPIEVAAINLVGTADASALHLIGNTLYVGRKSSAAPELYAFDATQLIQGNLQLLGTSEVGADVVALQTQGSVLLLGTGKNGQELQVWNKAVSTWSNSVTNAGRLSYQSSSNLAPLGFDSGGNNLYLIGQSQTQPEAISVIYSP